MDTPLNDRWEFVNCRPVNICVDCGEDFGEEYAQIGLFGNNHPNVTNLASTIRCEACVKVLQREELVSEIVKEGWKWRR
jgi:hypothetical protein